MEARGSNPSRLEQIKFLYIVGFICVNLFTIFSYSLFPILNLTCKYRQNIENKQYYNQTNIKLTANDF